MFVRMNLVRTGRTDMHALSMSPPLDSIVLLTLVYFVSMSVGFAYAHVFACPCVYASPERL